MQDAILCAAAETLGTPAYVFDVDALQMRAAAMRKLAGGAFRLCYSIKANPFLIEAMHGAVDALEVCSPGELTLCEKNGVDMARVVFSGVNKTAADVRRAVTDGVGIFTAESEKHLRLLQAEAAAQEKTLPVLLRLSSGNQFGMDADAVCEIVKNRAAWPNLALEGLHYFAGTQRRKPADAQADLSCLAHLMDRLKAEAAFETKKLEYGPGLPVPYFTSDDFCDTLSPWKALVPALQSMAKRVALTVEMGRFFAAECGFYLTAVNDVKRTDGVCYAILDGGMHHVNYYGQTMAMKRPVIRHLPQHNIQKSAPCDVTLCGSLCTAADVLVRSVPFAGLCEGDVLVFENIGAYSVTEGAYLFLSRSLPAIALYTETEGLRLVRAPFATDQLNCKEI